MNLMGMEAGPLRLPLCEIVREEPGRAAQPLWSGMGLLK